MSFRLVSAIIMHFNPRTPCGVRHQCADVAGQTSGISIHAPRAGCDADVPVGLCGGQISIHAPRAGCDDTSLFGRLAAREFQSTHPVRGATCSRPASPGRPSDFNPRTPCGVRPGGADDRAPRREFQSTHPVRGATIYTPVNADGTPFQSTHPVRGATQTRPTALPYTEISIHAPRAGCDGGRGRCGQGTRDFNPRTPCGVRRLWLSLCQAGFEFQSTHPVRGATIFVIHRSAFKCISIHAPRAGCDDGYPEFPEGSYISIHAPRAGCDPPCPLCPAGP